MSIARRIVHLGQRLYHRNIRRMDECATLIDWLAPAPGEVILDIGSGDGYYDSLIAAAGARVVGIDVHPARLAFARRHNSGPRIEYHRMDAGDLDFPDNSFDKVISFCVIEHLDDEVRVLQNIARVLKPGGALVLSADSLSNAEITPSERTLHRRRYSVQSFYTGQVLEERLAQAGLALERSRYVLTAPLSLALVRLSWRLDDLPKPLAALGAAGHALLGSLGKAVSSLAERVSGRTDGGLVLLATARKI